MRCETKKRGDEMQDKKNGDTRRVMEKNGEKRPKTKQMGRHDARQKKMGDKI